MHVPTDSMSYYGPHWEYRCDGCGDDRRLFPGDTAFEQSPPFGGNGGRVAQELFIQSLGESGVRCFEYVHVHEVPGLPR